jgi:hypothetical protein
MKKSMFAPLNNLTASPNNPNLAGQLASRKAFVGHCKRLAVYAVHSRFDAVSWFVADAYLLDELTGFPSIIRQEDTLADAIAGLGCEERECDCLLHDD